MLKTVIGTLVVFIGLSSAQAKEMADVIPNGNYVGSGLLVSKNKPWVPNMEFKSNRVVEFGIIIARSRAYFHGLKIADITAHLKIRKFDGKSFELLDLDDNQAVCGYGSCDQGSCKIYARVLNGKLSLDEKWVPSAKGFDVVEGSQIFQGTISDYTAKFVKTTP